MGQPMIKKPLELYIHVPFCIRKCNYCDFLSAPAKEETMAAYVLSLCDRITSYNVCYTKLLRSENSPEVSPQNSRISSTR